MAPDTDASDDVLERLTLRVEGPRPGDEPIEIEQLTHPDWESGHECPECGSNYIRETHLHGEIAWHEDGRSEYAGAGERLGTIEYMCDECETVLARHAGASFLLNHGGMFEK